jgi:arginyl-tRNA synthetase
MKDDLGGDLLSRVVTIFGHKQEFENHTDDY